MKTARAAILAASLSLVLTATAFAQIPDADLSTTTLDPQSSVLAGLPTCPAGDAATFDYVKVTVLDSGGTPIPGIPWADFLVSWSGGNLSFYNSPLTPVTDATGAMYFSVQANEAIAHPSAGGAPVLIRVVVAGVALNNFVLLDCNTYNYDLAATVGPIDFSVFAGDFGTVAPKSDFDWSGGLVSPIDFGLFAAHWGH
jgi:hypothetical protein